MEQRVSVRSLPLSISYFFKTGLIVNPEYKDLTRLTSGQTLGIHSSLWGSSQLHFCNRVQELQTQVVFLARCDGDKSLGIPVRD